MKSFKLLTRFLASFFFLGAVLLFGMSLGDSSQAASGQLPAAVGNLNISLRKTSYLTPTNTGYMRVFYHDDAVGIEYYDNQFQLQSKKTLPMELKLWGGFYAGSNAYYLVEGQANTGESDSAEVIRVIKYSAGWRRLGAASITSNSQLFGGDVRYPFDNGCVEFAERNGTLFIVTGHEGYVDASVGQGHQGFLMFAVDTASMTGKIVASDLWHSFAQYIKCKDSSLYVLEQSEGSRCTTLSKYNAETLESQRLSVLNYGGSRDSVWAISCYASVDGMEVSGSSALCLGTSIDQSKYDSVTENTPHNIYLTVTPLSNFSEEATTVKWLTNHTGGGKAFLGAKITKINDNRFMISWEEYGAAGNASTDDSLSSSILHYLFIDGNGNTVSQEFTAAIPISDCQPVVKNSEIVYYASNENMVNFYSINAQTGAVNKKMYRVAGENTTWDYSNGVLTISGTGAVSMDAEAFRYPVSSASSWFSYNSDERWPSIRGQVKKLVIKNGVTSIGERAFAFFNQLKEVEIESGLSRIDKEAFYTCSMLEKITIPASVTSIGEGILWSGYYWVGSDSPVVYAAIYTEYGSSAAKYAEKNNISYYISLDNASISGVKGTYPYNGKSVKPDLVVKLNGHTLKKGQDYEVTYHNNTKAGTATAKVIGINHYTGTVSVKFNITRPSAAKRLTDPKTKSVYTVTKQGTSVAYTSGKNVRKSTLTIPSKIKLKGVTYKVTSVSNNALKNNKKVKNVVIAGSVSKIGSGAFQGCTSLKKVKIGSGVKTIGGKAFYGCQNLTSIALGRNVTSIGSSAFGNCTSLKKITLPEKLTKLGSKAFYNCARLNSVTIRTKKLTSKRVGSKAFTKAGSANYKKLVIRAPKGKRSSYKTLLRKKGLSSKASVK